MLKHPAVSIKHSITTKLLILVFSTYLIITILLTGFHMTAEYFEAKDNIIRDMKSFQVMFGSVISQSVWDGDEKKIQALVIALQQVSFLTGISVEADLIGDIRAGTIIDSLKHKLSGEVPKQKHFGLQKEQPTNQQDIGIFLEAFSYRFPLIYQDIKGSVEIGSVTLYSNTDVVFQRVKLGFLFIIVNALIKTLALWLIFLAFGRILLNRPLTKLANATAELNLDNLNDFKLDIESSGRNELRIIEEGFHFMVGNLKKARDGWYEINQNLERLVKERTSELEQKTADLQLALKEKKRLNIELVQHRDSLEVQVEERTRELNKSIETLKETQNHMLQSEKMASLGNLVAGVAHEINTPLGIGVTEASYLSDITDKCYSVYKADKLTQDAFEKYLDNTLSGSANILKNLNRASHIIKSFKDVAVDQILEEKRIFEMKEYINEVLISLHPHLKRTKHTVEIFCKEHLEIYSYPGVFAQIITNLVMNSLVHGFEGIEQGKITFEISIDNNNLVFSYRDTGKGMDEKTIKSVFDPFFTTKRNKGGTGLGMHVVYNLVTQKLYGTITCQSSIGQKTEFIIKIPYEFQDGID